jgi:hypothetical protein
MEMRLVMVVWLPLAATTTMAPHLVRISVRKVSDPEMRGELNLCALPAEVNIIYQHLGQP